MTKTAVITGASSGIGEEYAHQLAERGYDLVLCARREEVLQNLAEQLQEEYNHQVRVVAADLTTTSGVDSLVEVMKAADDFALLVNNAGFGIPKQFLEIPYEKHQQMIDLHVTAVTKLSYEAMQLFMPRKRGAIITVTSVAAYIGTGMYTGTKRFQVEFSRRLAKIAKGTDIHIQALCPGYVRTGFHHTKAYEGKDVNSRIPSWLWMEPSYVVGVSLKKLQSRKVVVVPSFKYKLAIFISKFGLINRR